MTQDKMRRIITACVSAATVLLVFLLSYLIYQWITIANYNKKEQQLLNEIAAIERQIEEAQDDADYMESEFYLQLQLAELQAKWEILQGKK